MAYLLLYRYANLILDDLPSHPHARDPALKSSWTEARRAVRRALDELEVLKPRINERYVQFRAQQEIDSVSSESNSHRKERRVTFALDPDESLDAARAIAHMELRSLTRSTGNRSRHGRDAVNDDPVQSHMTSARQQLEKSMPRTSSPATLPPHVRQTGPSTYSYPTVSTQQTSSQLREPHDSPVLGPHLSKPTPPPKLPTPSTLTSPTPQFSTRAHLESSHPLRTIFLPSTLRPSFLRLAAHNTAANTETLGLLAGTLARNALFVTHLVLPAQRGTSDTCEMLDEAGLLAWLDGDAAAMGAGAGGARAEAAPGEPLMVLGWVHTHPTQTAFMSSRDLHTHCWYQAQMAESVALVCAPSREPSWGVFRLTDPPGLRVVRECRRVEAFHPHDEARLYTDALGGDGGEGHVIEADGLPLEVVDLRG